MKKQQIKILKSFRKSIVLMTMLSLLLVLLQACNPDDEVQLNPKANFEAIPDIDNPLKVSFTNTSTDALTYTWDFGDDQQSSETHPVHTYESPGTYKVILSAMGEASLDEFSLEIKINAPATTERYVNSIFSTVESKAGSYGSYSDNNYEFFEPSGDTVSNRPLIILAPGGNHNSFTRKEELVAMCEDLAKRGYVAAVIEYAQIDGAIEGKIQDFADLYVLGVRDQRSAIRYFRKNADQFGVDPDRIFIGGWSTGATLSFTTAYVSEEEMRSFEDQNLRSSISSSLDNFGGLENGDNDGVSSQANGALIMMGIAFDATHIDSSIPLMMINHEKAVTVSDCQSFVDTITMQTVDASVVAYGTNIIFDEAKKRGFTDGADLAYIYQTNWESGWKECDWYPNVSTLTSDNYQEIANFFSKVK